MTINIHKFVSLVALCARWLYLLFFMSVSLLFFSFFFFFLFNFGPMLCPLPYSHIFHKLLPGRSGECAWSFWVKPDRLLNWIEFISMIRSMFLLDLTRGIFIVRRNFSNLCFICKRKIFSSKEKVWEGWFFSVQDTYRCAMRERWVVKSKSPLLVAKCL